jgi:hypothetical protein
MTTFAPTFTPRWKGNYVAAGVQHSIQGRGPRGTTFSDMQFFAGFMNNLFGAVAAELADDFEWIDASIALTDSDVFLPATTPPATVTGLVDTTGFAPRKRIRALTFSGRTSTGRARISMFGVMLDDDLATDDAGDGIVTPAELAAIGTIVGILNTSYRGNSGELASYHNRGTYKENDHLLKLVRRGIIS